MEQIYFNPAHPAGFGGRNAVAHASKQKISKVTKFLNKQRVYRIFKQPKRRFERARILVYSLGVWFQVNSPR